MTAHIARSGVEIERLESRFRAATGSAEAARRELEFTRREAERLGIGFRSAAHAYSGFAAAARGTALEGEQARQIFIAVAEASRVMGLSADDTSGVLTALQQIISKGTVQAEELRGQLGERLPGAFQIAARAMGVELRKTFGPEVLAAAGTADAAFKRLGNAIDELEASIARSGLLDFLADAAKLAAKVIQAASGTGPPSGAGPLTALETRAAALRREIAGAEAANARAQSQTGRQSRRPQERSRPTVIDLEPLERELAETEAALAGQLKRLQEARDALITKGRGAGHAGVVAYNAALAALERDIAIIEKRIAAATAEAADLFGSRGRTSKDEEDEEDKKATAAERYADALERSIIAARDLSHEERALEAIRSGRLGEVTGTERRRIIAHAQELDRIRLIKEEEAALAEQREAAAREAEDAAGRHAEALEDIESAALALATPYQRAIAEIARWREAVLENLDEAAEGHERYAERVAEVERIAGERRRRAESEQERDRLESSRRWEDGVTRALRDIADEAGDSASAMASVTRGAFQRMTDALAEFVTTGKLDFSGLVNHIITELARIAIRKHIIEPLASGLEGLFKTGSTPPNLNPIAGGFGLPPGGSAGLLHTGGIVGAPGGRQRLVAPSLFDHAPRYHLGGIAGRLRPGEVPIIAEKGEGLFTPEQMRALAPAGPSAVYVNFVNQGTGQREAGREVRFQPPNAWVIEVVTEDIDNGGPLRSRIERLASPGGGV